MARVFLGLGTNLGDRRANLYLALRSLGARLRITAVSSLYDSAPVGYADQPRFSNLVCETETSAEPPALLALAKQVEHDLGRRPTVRYGPRVIDIDILLYDDAVVTSPDLTIPHPRLAERAFVLAPLAELAPDLLVPTLGRTVAALWAALPRQDIRRLEGEEGRLPPCTK